VYLNQHGGATSVRACLHDVYATRGEEFVVLDTGAQVRLDKLVSVNGIERPELVSCE
jgi:hypothetical protein